MRALAILVASLVAFGGLAGCVGDKDEPLDETSLPGTTTGATTGTGTGGQLKVLAPLTSSVTINAPAWVASGTEVPVKVGAPANAKGNLTYAWAIGALPGTAAVAAVNMDTGSKGADYIQPGASKPLTFATAGVYAMHCHPHPAMRHNVTVIDGYAGPKTVDVAITDGATPNEYRYVPENIVVGVGTTVNYRNVGAQPHTSTALGAQEPPLKALPLKAENGTVKVEGNGWMRILAIVQDGEGRLGIINQSIYVTPTLPKFEAQTFSFEFTHGAEPLIGTPAEGAPESQAVTLEQGGLVSINYTFADVAGASGAPENLAQVQVHFTKDGETQDTLTSEPSAEGALSGKAIAGAYTLKVVPLQGAQITGTVVVDVVYDLVPPAPAMPAAGGGHGDGHHH